MTIEDRMLFVLLLGFYPVLVWLMFWAPKKYMIYRLAGAYEFLKRKRLMYGYQFFERWSVKILEKPLVFLDKLLIIQMWYVFIILQVYGFVLFLFIKGCLGIDRIDNEMTCFFMIKLQSVVAMVIGYYHRVCLLDYQDQAEAKYLMNNVIKLWKMAAAEEDSDEEDDYDWMKSKE